MKLRSPEKPLVPSIYGSVEAGAPKQPSPFHNSSPLLRRLRLEVHKPLKLQLQPVALQRKPLPSRLILNIVPVPLRTDLHKEIPWLGVSPGDVRGERLLHEVDVFAIAGSFFSAEFIVEFRRSPVDG